MKKESDKLYRGIIMAATGIVIGFVIFLISRKMEEKELDRDYYG